MSEQFISKIKETRNIKDTSIKTYISALNKLKKSIDPNDKSELCDANFLKDFPKVMDAINKEKKITSKKNKLTAVLVALGCDETSNKELITKYGEKLKTMSEKYLSFLREQVKTETQKRIG